MSEDELALSFLLTEKFLSQAKLDAASRRLNSGLKIELPAHVKSAVLAAFESARAKQVEVEKKVGLNAYGWSIIAAVILLALLCFHPRPHYQWASFRDTAEAYEGFVKRFPSSAYTDTAKERARILREPEIWSHAKAVDQIESMRGYVRIYPDGRNIDYAKKRITELADAEWKLISNTNSRNEVLKFLKAYPEASKTREAEERLVSIADAQWDKISTTRSITAINTYLADYPETPRRREAEKRIEFLYSDWDWVREEDSIAAYQRFLTHNPNHPEQKWIEKRADPKGPTRRGHGLTLDSPARCGTRRRARRSVARFVRAEQRADVTVEAGEAPGARGVAHERHEIVRPLLLLHLLVDEPMHQHLRGIILGRQRRFIDGVDSARVGLLLSRAEGVMA